jgi:hypothetical protein
MWAADNRAHGDRYRESRGRRCAVAIPGLQMRFNMLKSPIYRINKGDLHRAVVFSEGMRIRE